MERKKAGNAMVEQGAGADIAARRAEAFEVLPGSARSGVLILCDHASNAMPPEYRSLGLPAGELQRHIAHDIGAAGVARALASMLGAPAVLAGFSRLLIDPNRGPDDPTLVMRIADGAVIPGNAEVDDEEKQARIRRFWQPYDDAIGGVIDAFLRVGERPLLVSVHTFTPVWRGVPRPWHAGILFDRRAPDVSPRMIDALRRRNPDLVIGENAPYSGGLPGDTLDRHGIGRGLPHTLVEVRQDLVASVEGQRQWARRIAEAVQDVLDARHATDAHLAAEAAGES